jgi:hypothetical protein
MHRTAFVAPKSILYSVFTPEKNYFEHSVVPKEDRLKLLVTTGFQDYKGLQFCKNYDKRVCRANTRIRESHKYDMISQRGSHMFDCGVNFRRGSPCDSNAIYIMHYHCYYNNNMFAYTQAPKERCPHLIAGNQKWERFKDNDAYMVCEYPLLILKDNRNLVFEVHNNIL